MTKTIEFSECPSEVCNYYDKGPSDKRVIRSKVRPIYIQKKLKGQCYVITHSYGVDYWRQDKWGDWKMWKTSEESNP